MNKSVLCVFIGAIGCSNREVLLESGLYQADPTAGALGLLSGVSTEILEDFQLELDVGNLTATPFAGQDTALTLDLIELETEQWQIGCPTPLITVYNQTFQFSADFSIGEVDLNGALLFASGCMTKKGSTVEQAWLSTESYQETMDVVGGMTGMLKLVKIDD